MQAVEVASIAEAASFMLERTRYWMFVAVGDEKTCEHCDEFGASVLTTYEVHQYFPYYEEQDNDLIIPNVHPNCRCMCVGAADDWGYTDTARVILAPPTADISDIQDLADELINTQEAGKLRMHLDYWLIRAAFIKVYGPQQGGKEFKLWLKKNSFSVTKRYGRRFKS